MPQRPHLEGWASIPPPTTALPAADRTGARAACRPAAAGPRRWLLDRREAHNGRPSAGKRPTSPGSGGR